MYKLLVSIVLLQVSSACAFYDAYPSDAGPYVSGPVSEQLSWPGEDFEAYDDDQLIECSADKSSQNHFNVTSGCLWAKHLGKWHRGWTDDRVFRAVSHAYDEYGRGVKWTDGAVKFRAYIRQWQGDTVPNWAGLHLFQRYRSSDDLYVASVRYDGTATIKRKWKGTYTTLGQAAIDPETHGDLLDEHGQLRTRRWIGLEFVAEGRLLRFSIDGTEVLSVSNGTFSWGTVGIRLDYIDAYLDDWSVLPVRKSH